ncbi:MAG TPA: hypothetical protein PKW90_07535 [Myxococcota bacterium]|nr:hypothetical protein [Myxococcota bacterium]
MTEFSRGAPGIVAHCSSGQGALQAMSAFAGRVPDSAALTRIERAFSEGAMDFAFWPEARVARMRFQSTLEGPELLTGEGDGAPVAVEPGHWYFDDSKGKRVHIHIANGLVDVVHEGVPDGDSNLPAAFLDLPAEVLERPGCAVFVDTSQRAEARTKGQILLHLPFQSGAGIYFALLTPTLAELDAIPAPEQAPASIHTAEAPDMVLAVGLGMADLKLDGVLKGEELRKFRRFQRAFPVADGTVVGATLGLPLRVGAVVPMERPIPGPVLARRLKRLLTELELPYEVVDSTHLHVDMKGKSLELSFVRGRVMLALDQPMLRAMEQDQGTAWLSGKTAELAGEFPLVLSVSRIPGKDGREDMVFPDPVNLSLGLSNGIATGYLVMPLSQEQLQQLLERGKGKLPGVAP